MSPISIPETSAGMLSGISVGSAEIVIWWVTCSSTPPSLTPGASSVPSSSIVTSASIASSSFTSSRSRWITWPRTGWRCWSLMTTGVDVAVELDVDQGAAVDEHVAQLALVDLEVARVGAAAVDDARHQPGAAQAAGGARTELVALRDLEGGAVGGHGDG